jgi:hypothetical protein
VSNLPDDVDERLWVKLEGREGRLFLGYNPHTFRGRMGAWSEQHGYYVSISKYEITDASEMARAWIAGFLWGNEPEPEEMFGDRIYLLDDDHDPKWQRWREAVADFRETGLWIWGRWTRLTPFPEGTSLPEFVWTRRGGDVWTWAGTRWVEADPPPELVDAEFLAGSVCAERGAHNDPMTDPHHNVCMDCGRSHEIGFYEEDL